MKYIRLEGIYKVLWSATLLLVLLPLASVFAIADNTTAPKDSLDDVARRIADESKVKGKNELVLTIQNVDIKRFPEVSLIVEARKLDGSAVDTIIAKDLTVVENGKEKRVTSVHKISVKERVPVDFVFVLDVTATMQEHINGVRDNMETFIKNITSRGIDYRLSLVLFSDFIEKTYPFTNDVREFLSWVEPIRAMGGGDLKENALEALKEASNAEFRAPANRVIVLLSDALYHQQGEKGNGRTAFTTQSMIEHLRKKQTRAFCIVPTIFNEYQQIAEGTRGAVFDLNQSFAKILDQYSLQLTNLYAITFRSDEAAIPDSINVAILNEKKQELLRKTIPIVEIGRKLIIENLLFASSSSKLPGIVPELEVLAEFMTNKPQTIIKVEGHTDNRGKPLTNKRLSLQRAESVKQFLISRGIASRRVQTVGYGDTKPIADNSTDFGRNLNRRTEVVIVAK